MYNLTNIHITNQEYGELFNEDASSSSSKRSPGAAIPYNDDDVIPSNLILNNPRIESNTNLAISTTSQPETEEEYDYDYTYEYDPEVVEEIDYNDFSSFESEQKYDTSQKEISGSLPSSVYCDLVNTLNTKCFETSILEIWRYHEETIMNLTQEDILHAINVVRKSPYFGFGHDFAGKLGGIVRDEKGLIIGAKSALHSWVSTVDETKVVKSFLRIDNEKVGAINLDWELELIEIALNQAEKWHDNGVDMTVKVNVARSFNDISGQAIFGDLQKVIIGYLIMFLYTTIMLGRLNKVEQRFYLTAGGLFSVLMGIGIGIGITSALGFPYIPLHAMLPFICLGIGIDDMFVIVQCLHNINANDLGEHDTVEERMGVTLKHAGVAITVTSLTDMFAFGIGAVTILPGLQAFCISCAFAIGAIYLLQASWFVACLALDEKRIKERKNAFCPTCITYPETWQPSEASQKQYGQMLLRHYSKLLNSTIYKLSILLLTLSACGVGLWGTINIRTKFDPSLLLPPHSYLLDWIKTHQLDYPKDGWGSDIYTGAINPLVDLPRLDSLVNDMVDLSKGEDRILKGIDSWWLHFKSYIKTTSKNSQPTTSKFSSIGYNPENFSLDLSNFLFSQVGARYKLQILFDGNLTCDSPAPPILATKTGFQYDRFAGPTQHAPARRKVEQVMESNQLTSRTFSFSKIYAAWETDEIIAKELWRNMGLAMICVFVITLLLLADIKICVLVFICVVLTLVDIVGILHFWDVTIDTISCINIVLAIGLCVDYSAHIAHAFLVAEGSSIERSQTAISTMGPAIANGGITTFLAVIPLFFSGSHVFLTFFKVFFLTVIFGLFHGIIFLPVILSWIGSESKKSTSSELGIVESDRDVDTKSKNLRTQGTLSNVNYVQTYNSVQDINRSSDSNGGGAHNPSFIASNSELDKNYSHPNFVHPDVDSCSKSKASKRWNPFQKFKQTYQINE